MTNDERDIRGKLKVVNVGGIMLHAERSGGPVAAAQKYAAYSPLSVSARGRGCRAWSFMRRYGLRLSMRVWTITR